MPTIVKKIHRPSAGLARKFLDLGVATVHESIGKETNNAMDAGIKPIEAGMAFSGPAVTAECFPGDNSTLHIAMTLCEPGDILVADCHRGEHGFIGGQMVFQFVQRRIGGVVIDGGVRDSRAIREMRFPCFARHISPLGTAKGTLGSVNVPIQCGGVVVNPGDIVVGDDDGVVVVRRANAADVLERASARNKKEKGDRLLYKQGKTSVEMLGLDRLLQNKGVTVAETGEDVS